MIKPATQQQARYLDLANHYTERAMKCYGHELWPEVATNFGSVLESLLRIRFGRGGTLFDLIDRFDKDSLFASIFMHDGASQRCTTCFADGVRKLRNAVHPDRWRQATNRDVDRAGMLVLMLYHVLVVCDTRVADFEPRQDSILNIMEVAGFHTQLARPDSLTETD